MHSMFWHVDRRFWRSCELLLFIAVSARRGRRDSVYRLLGRAEPLRLQTAEQARKKAYDLIPGFVRGAAPEPPAFFPPPRIPHDYEPVHRFAPDTPGAICALMMKRSHTCLSTHSELAE